MFNLRVRAFSGAGGQACIRLPAAVAFPTDVKLLERIETSRKALPKDNMKALWRSMPRGAVMRAAS